MNPELTQQQQKKLERTKFVTPNTDMGMFAVMQDVAESLDKLAGAETIRIEGKQGKPGKDGKDGKDGAKGEPGEKGETGKDGKNGKDGKDGLNGKDGKDGKDGKNGKDGKDGEMGVIDDATIGYLENEIKKLKDRTTNFEERIKNLRGGGTSALGVAQTFKYIAHTEEPTGAIDGANLSYTVKNTIWWVAGFTLNGEQIAQLPNFTVSGRTITFSSALPAVYSGKDFEVKYIGT